jgi:2-polyprenyl-6-methoxyphenol hydroxylase-like FAD-dependent oxidoreductase
MPYRVVVIGAGFGGIGMAIALKQAGIEDFVVVDRQLGRHCLDPALPWRAQRRRLDQLIPASLLPRGTTFAEQAIGGVRAEVVSARGSGSQRTVIHFHGGGYMEG